MNDLEKKGPPQWFLDALEEDKQKKAGNSIFSILIYFLTIFLEKIFCHRKSFSKKTESKDGDEGQPALEDGAAAVDQLAAASDPVVQPAPAATGAQDIESMD